MRDRNAEKFRMPEDRMQRDEATMTPADNSKLPQVCIRNYIAQKLSSEQNIIDFLATVIDQIVEIFSVSRTSPILGSDNYIAFSHERPNVRHVSVAQITVNSIVHENERSVLARRV